MYEEIGKSYGAYTLEQKQQLVNMNGTGYVFRHNKTKARVAVISNDDDNKVFNIAFRTPPTDDTGVPHIMEHSVLCGSRKFPVKDPFVELVKGSLNTFLNAMTYPDKTVYPVASCNDKDFQNLMDVYLDAVFHPNIYAHKEIMMQEGWHYECEDVQEPIRYNGVVYNEMKGVFSSPEGRLDRMNLRTMYPDTPYSYESGGDPEAIPDLTYEQFLEFHRKYYHPSNSYIYLYGDMDIEEKLDFIDREYLSEYEYLEVDSHIAKQQSLDGKKEYEGTYAITDEEEEKDKTYFSYNVVVGESTDERLCLAMQILEYVLLNVPGAPVKRALIDAGIGKDVMSSYETSIAQPMFSIIAANANPEQKEQFVSVLRQTLKDLVEQGLSKKSLKAAINIFEFQNREANFGSYPKGLMYGLRMLDSWLYDDTKVFTHVVREETFAFLKEQVQTDYFEQLIQRYLLENSYCTLVTLKPEKNLAAKQDAKTEEKLKAYKESLSEEQVKEVIANTAALQEYQDSEDADEDLRKIPLLQISDVEKKTKPYINEVMEVQNTKVVAHDIFTNGIAYVRFSFDMRELPLELVPVSSLLVNLLKQVDTENYSYQELASEINLNTGGIMISNSVYKNDSLPGGFGAAFQIQVKALYEQVPRALELVQEIMLTSNLRDEKRLLEIVEEQRLAVRSDIVNGGHLTMANRAMSYFDQGAKYKEMMDLTDYYQYLVELKEHFEERKGQLMEQLEQTVRHLFTPRHLTISIACDEDIKTMLEQPLMKLRQALYEDQPVASLPEVPLTFEKEGFKTSSQVQYAACAGDFRKAGFTYTGALLVLKMIFSYEYLWTNIRVKGGAYGCACTFGRLGIGYFTSYRDPNLKNTYEVYKKAAEFVEQFDVDERTMTKYIIGAISSLDMPLTPSAYASQSFAAYLSGLTTEQKQKERDEVLGTNVEKIRELAPIVKAVYDTGAFAALGNAEKITQQAELFDKVVTLV